jgi:hypothetical protein
MRVSRLSAGADAGKINKLLPNRVFDLSFYLCILNGNNSKFKIQHSKFPYDPAYPNIIPVPGFPGNGGIVLFPVSRHLFQYRRL